MPKQPYTEKRRARRIAYYYANPERSKEATRKWARKNVERLRAHKRAKYLEAPEKWRDSQLKRDFGITLAQFNAMAEAQDHRCGLCEKIRKLHVDHDHSTGRLRGLLCSNCNTGLGLLKDDASLLRRAIAYLGCEL